MAVDSSPSHQKTSSLPAVFSIKSSSSSSSNLISLSCNSKLKTVVQTFILSHLYRIVRSMAKAKSLVIQIVKDFHFLADHFMEISIKKNKKRNKLFLGSFRMHYNWCSSHVVPIPMPPPATSSSGRRQIYYDSTWNTIISTEEYVEEEQEETQDELSGYLHWLEQRAHHHHAGAGAGKGHANNDDIDRLADMFIANSHEKFRLEKQESYRRFQEMMARSV